MSSEECKRWFYDVCLCGCIRQHHVTLVAAYDGPCDGCMKRYQDRLPTGELWYYICNGFINSNYNKFFETVSPEFRT